MNIGQVLELHLGYAARELGMYFATPAFDGINSKDLEDIMKEAGMSVDGKQPVISGMTGEYFDSNVSVGVMYMIKLAHMVDDKLHARSVGPIIARSAPQVLTPSSAKRLNWSLVRSLLRSFA